MSIFFRKQDESPVRCLINTYRASIDKLNQLDDGEKEKIAELLRHLWLNQYNTAYEISKKDPREGKKLTRQAHKDEAELERFLSELGVPRYSPDDQRKIKDAEVQLEALTREAEKICQEIEKISTESREQMDAIEKQVDESIRNIERQIFRLDPIAALIGKLKEWLSFWK